MALVDAGYCFISTDVGAYGSSSDCNIFKNSNFCKKLEGNHLNIPGPRPLPNEYNGTPRRFIVGDEAFALSQHVLRPYPSRNLDVARRIYIITDQLGQEEWWNVHLAYCVINGEIFTVRLMFAQISAM